LEPSFSTTSRWPVPGTGRIYRCPYGSQLRDQSLAHAPNHWLDSTAFCFPICARTCWVGPRLSLPTGGAPRSGRFSCPPEAPHTTLA
jgi:hypothetical protein